MRGDGFSCGYFFFLKTTGDLTESHVTVVPKKKRGVNDCSNVVRTAGTEMFYFEGNGGNKSLLAREGTLVEVSRGGDGDDHHQSWKVRRQTYRMFFIIHSSLQE